MGEYLGCGDHSCMFDKPRGQGTNGGCRCLHSMTDRRANLRVHRAVARLRARVAKLEAERDHANMVADAAIEELKLCRERKQSRSQGPERKD